jgi:hypothetical protein
MVQRFSRIRQPMQRFSVGVKTAAMILPLL